MKKFSLSLAAAFAAMIVASAAHAEATPGWYVAAGVGATFPENSTVHATTKYDVENEDSNVSFLGSLGYAFDNGVRVEAQYFHDQKNAHAIGATPVGGHVTDNAVFLNMLYDLHNETILTPYIGAGIGPDFVHVDHVGTAAANLNGDAVVAAYQGIAGVAAKLDEEWAMTLDYRYIGSFDPKVGYTPGTEARITNSAHNVMVGLRYTFAEPPPVVEEVPVVAVPPPPPREVTPPQVRAQPVPAPVVAPVEENFTVFFDFDKSTLTPEAKRIISAAAAKFKNGGFARIIVIGHTDTVGTKSYNQKLSERRALSVKRELVALGVGPDNIRDKGVGMNGLLVPTTEGVREAQNRRAEIDLVK